VTHFPDHVAVAVNDHINVAVKVHDNVNDHVQG
jgi:hypothetical protein